MYVNLTHMDTAILLSLGFTCGIAEGLYWGVDKNNDTWHVQDDGRWLRFAKCANGHPGCYERMPHTTFNSLFRKPFK